MIVLAIVFAGLMLVGAASAADISVADYDNQDSINHKGLKIYAYNDSDESVNALNAVPSEDISALRDAILSVKVKGNYTTEDNVIINVASTGSQYTDGYVTVQEGNTNLLVSGNRVQVSKKGVDITLKQLTEGKHTITVTLYSSSTSGTVRSTDTLTIYISNPKDPSMNVTNVKDVTYGETFTANIILPSDINGTVTIYLDGVSKGTVTITNGKGNYTIPNNLAVKDNYNLTVKFLENDKYNADEVTEFFNVTKSSDIDVNVVANASDIVSDDKVTVTVTLSKNVTGNVTLYINGNANETKDISGNNVIFDNIALPVGINTITAVFNGNENYTNKSGNNVTVNVAKEDPTIDVDVKSNMHVDTIVEGDDVIVIVTLPEDATGTVRFSIDGGKTWVYADVIDGIACYTFKGLKAGEYNLLVEYSGDNNYNGIETQTVFVVEEVPTPSPKDLGKESMPNTGNPLLVLLIALTCLGLGSLRRKL